MLKYKTNFKILRFTSTIILKQREEIYVSGSTFEVKIKYVHKNIRITSHHHKSLKVH
jgi:hypothetical protein